MSSKTTQWILELVDKITSPLHNVQGAADDAAGAVEELNEQLDEAEAHGESNGFSNMAAKIGATAFVINQVSDAIGKANQQFQNAIAPGVNFQNELANLSVVTQKSADELKSVTNNTKELAETYGGSADNYLNSANGIIANLGDTIADNDAIINHLNKNVAIMSKLMGGDAKGAATALTSTMLQFRVNLNDTNETMREADRIMNVLQAGANVGGSEITDTAAAVKEAGGIANNAAVSIEELVASLETFSDIAKGNEAGTAIRNLLVTLDNPKLLSPKLIESMQKSGVSFDVLTDHSLTLTQRLRELSKASQGDRADFFNRAGIAVGERMLQSLDLIDQYKEQITNTSAAIEGAGVIMDTYSEKMSRTAAWVDNLKISFFNAVEPIAPFITLTGDAMSSVTEMGIAIWGLSILLKKDLYVSIWNSIKAIGTWISTSSVATAATSIWTGAQWLLNAAFIASPIGWIVVGIGALVGAIVLCWNKFEGFRGVVMGVWEVIKGFGNILKDFVIDRIKGIISGLGAMGQAIASLFKGDFSGAWDSAKQGLRDLSGVDAAKNAWESGKNLGEAFQTGYTNGVADFRADKARKESEKAAGVNPDASTSIGAKSITGNQQPIVKPFNQNSNGNSGIGKNTISGTGGSGGGKSVTMNVVLNINNHGVKNPDEFTEQVVRKINDRLNDALAIAC